jgi:uncharacterized protein YfcZ (UPF0381/DUF406 family)
MKTLGMILALLLLTSTAHAEIFAIDTTKFCQEYESLMADVNAALVAFTNKKAGIEDKQVEYGCIAKPEMSLVAEPVKLDADLKPVIKAKAIIIDEPFVDGYIYDTGMVIK